MNSDVKNIRLTGMVDESRLPVTILVPGYPGRAGNGSPVSQVVTMHPHTLDTCQLMSARVVRTPYFDPYTTHDRLRVCRFHFKLPCIRLGVRQRATFKVASRRRGVPGLLVITAGVTVDGMHFTARMPVNCWTLSTHC